MLTFDEHSVIAFALKLVANLAGNLYIRPTVVPGSAAWLKSATTRLLPQHGWQS
jgi:hypothetical protein